MAYRVKIAQRDAPVEVALGQTILDAALAAGIPYPHGCRSGNCGACKSRLVSGEIAMSPYSAFALDETERDSGLVLACRSVPWTDAEIAWLDDEEIIAHPIRRMGGRIRQIAPVTRGYPARAAGDRGRRAVRLLRRAVLPGTLRRPARTRLLHGQRSRRPGGRVPHPPCARRGGQRLCRRNPGARRTGPPARAVRHLLAARGASRTDLRPGRRFAPRAGQVDRRTRPGRRPCAGHFPLFRCQGRIRPLSRPSISAVLPPPTPISILSRCCRTPPRRPRTEPGCCTKHWGPMLRTSTAARPISPGPPAMVEATRRLVIARGIRAEDVHADAFYTQAEKTGNEAG